MTTYQADFIVHTLTGPIACCEKHAIKLQKINKFMGAHTVIEPITERDDEECSNCRNEARKNDPPTPIR